ncbi:uncharacterized protein DUF4256 [Sphingobacterium alimentarium]|uniref:Uncharacterized protein DUF4256 n=1 Tax=Sphingobacterium alimentarium TaxID=797292 RepID=A0A4R3W0P5_9SPHI|nr:DUF4256 domain-containing protein [Sphingobacterium alimentarium]TCV18764.1 uncharacterized protein DUF4256 [Sphingobacterium alimentarium]
MNQLSKETAQELINTLEKRFLKFTTRHPNIDWESVKEKLQNNPSKLLTIYKMEETGGEPDVIGKDEVTQEIIFADCVAESPKGRRSVCYDHEALESRKQYKPENSAVHMAEEIGIELMDEEQYHAFQQLGEFDLKTSSWIKTPVAIRAKGGALFGDRRFGRVFTYHNGAESYYGVRGFRGILKI